MTEEKYIIMHIIRQTQMNITMVHKFKINKPLAIKAILPYLRGSLEKSGDSDGGDEGGRFN